MVMARFLPALVLAALCGVVDMAWAQAASVSGRIVDAQGGVVANAEVTLTAAGTPRSRAVRSRADGTFTFEQVVPGEYVLLIQAPGFAPWSLPVVAGAAPQSLTATLQVAGVIEDVTVQGALAGTVATGKTTLPIRELPMTVHGVPERVIQEQGANDLVAALQNVSGVHAFTQYGIYEGYTFRGFLDLFPSQAVQLVDGVRNEGNRINTQLTNIERVEVLKGPSSALYGGGAIGATVNLIRKKPSAQPAYDFSVAAGSWKTGRGTFGATGRLGDDSVLYRLDAGLESRDGYRHNDATRVSVTPSVAWRIGQQDQVNVYYTYNRDRVAGDAGIPLLPGGTFPDVPRDRNYRTPRDQATANDHNLQIAYARQLGNSIGFRNTLSYRHVNDDYLIAEFLWVESPSTVMREYLQFTHHRRPLTNIAEVTGRVRLGLEHSFVAGWEGQRFHNDTHRAPGGGVADAEPIDLFNPVETQPDLNLPLGRIDYFTNNTNAFYFQDHLTLTSQVKALLGGRYDIFRRRMWRDNNVDGVLTPSPSAGVGRFDAEAFTGRAGLVYQPAPALDLYGSYASSFRPLAQVQPDGTTLDPERGTQFEFGQRVRFVGDRVQLNTAVYRLVRENVPFSRPGGFFEQAGEVRSRGFEADVSTTFASNWRVTGGYGFTDAEFTSFVVSATQDLTGNTPEFAPRHTLSVWTSYDWVNGLGMAVGVRALSSHFSHRTNQVAIDRYGLVNVALRYARGPVEYALNVNNLTNTKYFASALYTTQMYPGEPINVLGTVRVRLR